MYSADNQVHPHTPCRSHCQLFSHCAYLLLQWYDATIEAEPEPGVFMVVYQEYGNKELRDLGWLEVPGKSGGGGGGGGGDGKGRGYV